MKNFIFFFVLILIFNLIKRTELIQKTTLKRALTSHLTNYQIKTTLTTILQNKTTECYQTFHGVYRGHLYNATQKIQCKTNCFSYKIINGSYTEDFSSCSNVDTCIGGYYLIRPNYAYQYQCCNSSLCNTNKFTQKLLSSKCHLDKKLDKSKQLVYPAKSMQNKTVTKCYYCEKCLTFKSSTVISCSLTDNNTNRFACLYGYFSYKGLNYYYFGCVATDGMYMLSYDNIDYKVMYCQSDMCNSPERVQALKNATLCSDGFYA